ncbi:MAG TPA: hypothetical protein DIT64_22910 [Verrucomicrobiales bacterium]|nr:hypothetical protein [Verrucomicrobiales bacterium]
MNPDSLFKSMLGIDLGMMRTMAVLAAFCVFVLVCYRLHVIVDCMRRPPSEFPTPTDRIVWTVLAAFVPLGIGAYLYHVVALRRPLQWFFLVPFGIIVAVAGYLAVKMWPMSANFPLKFLGL